VTAPSPMDFFRFTFVQSTSVSVTATDDDVERCRSSRTRVLSFQLRVSFFSLVCAVYTMNKTMPSLYFVHAHYLK
jgi:hypothetical protein